MSIFESLKAKATQKESGLYYYVNPIDSKPDKLQLFMWQPKARKPYFNYIISKDKLEFYINQADTNLIAHKKSVIERRNKAKATPEKMKQIEVGQIFVCSWGYEQTNVDFYQVTSVKSCMIGLRRIGSTSVEDTSWASANVMPVKDSFKGDEFFKRVSFECGRPSLNMSSFSTAFLWSGKPQYCSWWG